MPTMERISVEEYNRRRSAGHFNQFKPVPLPIQSADVSTTYHPDVLHDDDIDDDSDDELGALAYKSSRTAKLREAEEIPSSEVPVIEEQVAKRSKNDVANYNTGSKNNNNNTFENSLAQLEDNFTLAVAQMQKKDSSVTMDYDQEKQHSSPTRKMGGKKSCRELPTDAVTTLKAWLLSPEHIGHPYPTPQDMIMLMQKTGMDEKQLKNWFANARPNARRRIWKPMKRKQQGVGESGKVGKEGRSNMPVATVHVPQLELPLLYNNCQQADQMQQQGGDYNNVISPALHTVKSPSSLSSNEQNKQQHAQSSADKTHAAATDNNSTTGSSERKDPPEPEGDQPKKKRKIYICSNEGCNNKVLKGGFCWTHGAKLTAKIKTCSQEGCANQVQSGGVCIRHGAKKKRKTCSQEGCTNRVVKGGVCTRHGAKRKKYTCSYEGCTNKVQKGGVCYSHGANVKTCSTEGCTNQVRKGGVCVRHGAKLKICSHEGCTNQVVKGGVCIRHGASWKKYICKHEGCTNQVVKGGVCKRHGAKNNKEQRDLHDSYEPTKSS